MGRPIRFASAFLPLAMAVALPVAAGQVYTWKDARGVTHYADAPPAGQTMKARTFGERPVPPTAPKAVANSDCSNARSNFTLLQGTARVGVDDNKDGKIDRELTAAERAARLKVAEGQVELYCEKPAADAVTTRKG
ncbi:DUF4124 domain-containing protein [Cognatilysobacter lacus]|uniref:DUF4124 domain-containing protein n=1 Tax=Cognatilysobacter lacus TaxID=1643323 RepID=A0A5D8ZAW8_9GAMM|nr:DUF4124 domain-containing protein [Lysobacter lacus]TZF91262.1 DUF4124 domain-containing protein [Lysobacter lacus]